MGEGTSELREEIEETRQRVGEEVEALSYKTDVGARASDYVEEKKEAVKSKLTGAKDTMTGVVPDRRAMQRGVTHVRDTAESNPLGLALGGLAVSRYKIRVHRAAVAGLFRREAVVLGPIEIAELAREIITPSLD